MGGPQAGLTPSVVLVSSKYRLSEIGRVALFLSITMSKDDTTNEASWEICTCIVFEQCAHMLGLKRVCSLPRFSSESFFFFFSTFSENIRKIQFL